MSEIEVRRSIDIRRPLAEVFEYVADCTNDPRWCKKVESVRQVEGEGPGPGARYVVVHRLIPRRPVRQMDHRCVAWSPPPQN